MMGKNMLENIFKTKNMDTEYFIIQIVFTYLIFKIMYMYFIKIKFIKVNGETESRME